MMREDRLLTLVVPPQLEEKVVAVLLEHPDLAPRFVCLRGEGHGQAIALSGSAELVRGRSSRALIQLVLGEDALRRLLASLREAVPSPEVAYWTVPLGESGRLA